MGDGPVVEDAAQDVDEDGDDEDEAEDGAGAHGAVVPLVALAPGFLEEGGSAREIGGGYQDQGGRRQQAEVAEITGLSVR